MTDFSLIVLRLCLATVFLAHGMQIAFGCFGGPGISGFAGMLTGMGFKPAIFWAYLSAYTQLIASIFIILGFLTRYAAFSIFIFMAVALVRVHLSKGFFLQNGGFEYNFVLICICIALMLSGSGRFGITPKL